MKRKYMVGLFAALFVFIVFLNAGYRLSYQSALERHQAGGFENQTAIPTVPAEGEAVKKEGYVLKELHGNVAVFLADEQTLYELTEIAVQTLPAPLRQEIEKGKHLKTEAEVYAFLENYSS